LSACTRVERTAAPLLAFKRRNWMPVASAARLGQRRLAACVAAADDDDIIRMGVFEHAGGGLRTPFSVVKYRPTGKPGLNTLSVGGPRLRA
jgi:hypothetical protein